MDEILMLNSDQNKDFLVNRIKVYIWNKERLKVLKEFYPSSSKNLFQNNKSINSRIIELLDIAGKMFEKLPSTYKNKEEEDLRDHILLNLQVALKDYSITGESFNQKGKTDILIKKESENLFIGECKFWKGQKSIHETIDQILKYSTWRDTFSAIIFFVRNKDIKRVLKQIEPNVKAHKKCLNFLQKEDLHIFSFEMKSQGETSINLKIMLFHIPK